MKWISVLLVFAALGLSLATSAPCAAQDAGLTASEPGLFSYQAPKDWKVMTNPGSKYALSVDAPHGQFAANINVVAEDFAGSLADYLATNKKLLKSAPVFTDLTMGEEQPWTTNTGEKGFRLAVTDTMGKLKLAQVFFFFDAPKGQKLVVTCSSLAPDAVRYAPLFDASMKTFMPK